MKHEDPQNLHKLNDTDLSHIAGGTPSTSSPLSHSPDTITPGEKPLESTGILLQSVPEQSDSPVHPGKFIL